MELQNLILKIFLLLMTCLVLKIKTSEIIATCPIQFQPQFYNDSCRCKYELDTNTRTLEYSLKNIKWKDGMVQHIHAHIILHGNDTRFESDDVIVPNEFLLTYIDPEGPFYYVSWSSDFKVLSLGFLNDYANKAIDVNLRETSGKCSVGIGSNTTTIVTIKEFLKFIRKMDVLDKKFDYENIFMCFLSKFDWFEKSPWYNMKRYFGIPFQQFGYKCCMLRNETVCCDDKLHRIEGYRLIPYIISVLLICYSPLYLLSIGNVVNSTETLEGYITAFCKYPVLLGILDDQDLSEEDELNCTYCCCECCIQCYHRFCECCLRICECCLRISECCRSCCSECCRSCCSECCRSCCSECCRRCCSQVFLKRLWRFLFLSLTPIMIYIEVIVFSHFTEWSDILKKINEQKLLFGFASLFQYQDNRTFLSPVGPVGALCLYYLLGFFIIILPYDFQKSVLDKGACGWLITTKDILAGSKHSSSKGYQNIKQVLQTIMFLPLNAVYWKTRKTGRKFCRVLFIIFIYPLIFLPIVPFLCIVIKGWACYSWDKTRGFGNSFRTFKCCFYVVCRLILTFFSFCGFLLFTYLLIIIISYSIYLLIYIIYFTSLAFIISPDQKSKIIVFCLWGIIFLCQILKDTNSFYSDLFRMTIDICHENDSLRQKYMITENHEIFIKKELVVAVYRKVHPVYVQIGHIIMKLVIVILIFVSCLLFLNRFSDSFEDTIEHITVLVTSITPLILEYNFRKTCPEKRFVEYTIHVCDTKFVDLSDNHTDSEETQLMPIF